MTSTNRPTSAEPSPLKGVHVFPSGAFGPEVADEYLSWLRDVRRRQALTVYQYAAKFDLLFAHVGRVPLDGLTVQQLEGWVNRPRTRRGKGGNGADATVAKEVSLLRGLWRYAASRGYVTSDPTAQLHAPTVRNANPNPISDELWARQWAPTELSDEARTFLGLGFVCGLRRSEIVSCAVNHVDVRRRRIVKLVRKGGGDDVLDYGELASILADGLPELLPSADTFLEAVARTVRNARRDGLLFDWTVSGPIDPQMVYRRLAVYQEVAGISVGAWTPHMLRHGFVTNLLRIGVPVHLVSRLANHSNVATTMRYAKVSGSDLRDWRRRESALRGQFGRFG